MVRVSERYFRPAEVDLPLGDPLRCGRGEAQWSEKMTDGEPNGSRPWLSLNSCPPPASSPPKARKVLGWHPETMTSVEELVEDMVTSDLELAQAEMEKKRRRGGKLPA